MDKKKIIIISIAAVVAVAAIVVGIIFAVKANKKVESNEAQLKENLEKLGRQFYEEFYYPHQVSYIETSNSKLKKGATKLTLESHFSKLSTSGVVVDLENISKYSKINKELVDSMTNSKTNEKCDVKNTKINVKPTKPYGNKDYTIEVTLACGSFE
jgi:hypothetical protein